MTRKEDGTQADGTGKPANGKKKPATKSFGMWGIGSGGAKKKTLDTAAIAALKKKVSGQEAPAKSVGAKQLITVVENQDFVGENIQVTRQLEVGSKEHEDWLKKNKKTGIDAVLAAIGPKKQITTLNKSDIDWQQFKAEAKITDELEQHKRNGGFLEKQDFIARTEENWLKKDQAENRKRLGVNVDDE